MSTAAVVACVRHHRGRTCCCLLTLDVGGDIIWLAHDHALGSGLVTGKTGPVPLLDPRHAPKPEQSKKKGHECGNIRWPRRLMILGSPHQSV